MDWSHLAGLVSPFTAGLIGAFAGAAIQGRYWVAQEKWKLKSQYYESLLKNLARQARWFKEMEKLEYARPKDDAHRKEYEATIDRIVRLREGFKRTRAVADIWLPPEVFESVDVLDKHLKEEKVIELGMWEAAEAATERLRQEVLGRARKDLRLRLLAS